MFTAGASGNLDTVSLFPKDDWSGYGMTMEIRASTSGPVLASQAWTSSATLQFVDLAFANPATVVAGSTYVIVLVPTAGSGRRSTRTGPRTCRARFDFGVRSESLDALPDKLGGLRLRP